MARLRSPICWFGGKGHMTKRILPLLPEHQSYVEPFGGGASLLFAKEPSEIEVYNDLDSGLVNLFRVLRDPDKFGRLYHLICLTPYAREEHLECRQLVDQAGSDDVMQAFRWYVVARSSFGGNFGGGWGYTVTKTSHGMAGACSKWMSAIHMLPAIHERLMRVLIEHADFRSVIERFDSPTTLFYCDPPYVPETRRSGRYRCEMTADDHKELVGIFLRLQGRVVLSGYNSAIYQPLEEAGWIRHDFQTACAAAGRTRATGILGTGAALRMQPRTESVWMSP